LSGKKDLKNGQMRGNISGNRNKNKCQRQQLLAAPKWFIAAFLTVKCACVHFLFSAGGKVKERYLRTLAFIIIILPMRLHFKFLGAA